MFSASEHLPGSTPEFDLGAAYRGCTVDAAHFRAACGIALGGKSGSDRDLFHVEIERTAFPTVREREDSSLQKRSHKKDLSALYKEAIILT